MFSRATREERMMRRRTGVAVGLAALALATTGCGGDDDDGTAAGDTDTTTETAPVAVGTTLLASVGPGFEISLATDEGAVSSLAAGTYTVEVDDQSPAHNFHLTGPGVDESTDVGETGAATWEVTLEPGTYSFVCDPHAGSMNGGFEVSG
jgi:plastocyanin